MEYLNLIKTVSLIIENEEIESKGLVLTYHLDEKEHTKMNQELYYRTNPDKADFIPSDEFEVEIGEILIKFIKK
jgi:hypothetical protein